VYAAGWPKLYALFRFASEFHLGAGGPSCCWGAPWRQKRSSAGLHRDSRRARRGLAQPPEAAVLFLIMARCDVVRGASWRHFDITSVFMSAERADIGEAARGELDGSGRAIARDSVNCGSRLSLCGRRARQRPPAAKQPGLQKGEQLWNLRNPIFCDQASTAARRSPGQLRAIRGPLTPHIERAGQLAAGVRPCVAPTRTP